MSKEIGTLHALSAIKEKRCQVANMVEVLTRDRDLLKVKLSLADKMVEQQKTTLEALDNLIQQLGVAL